MQGNQDRFKDADFMKVQEEILLVGLGGIGNGVGQKLLDCNQHLVIFEPDIIDEHNCIPQGYFLEHVNLRKIDAFKHIASKRFVGEVTVEHYDELYDENSIAYPIMVAAVDNYKTRQIMFHNWKQQSGRKLFVDGRMLAEWFQIFAITPETEDWYEETYLKNLDDSMEEAGLCTYQQTSFVASIIHGMIVQKILNFITDKPIKPFYEYNGIIDLL